MKRKFIWVLANLYPIILILLFLAVISTVCVLGINDMGFWNFVAFMGMVVGGTFLVFVVFFGIPDAVKWAQRQLGVDEKKVDQFFVGTLRGKEKTHERMD